MHPDIPAQVDSFTNLCPLEAVPGNLMQKSHTFGYVTSVYKVSYFLGWSQSLLLIVYFYNNLHMLWGNALRV